METFYFTLGVLSIIAIIFIVALVWGLVKVVRTKKDLEDFKISYQRDVDYDQRILDENKRELDVTVDHIYRRIDELHQESKSHTDKRADQLRQILTESKS
jgi:flagellar biogenesis protein FliO